MMTWVSFVFGLCCLAWAVIHRFRLAWLEDELEATSLDVAIAERRAEAGPVEVSA